MIGALRLHAAVCSTVSRPAVALSMLADTNITTIICTLGDLSTIVPCITRCTVALLIPTNTVGRAVFGTANKLCAVLTFPSRITVATPTPANATCAASVALLHERAILDALRFVIAESGVAEALAMQAKTLVAAVIWATTPVFTGITTVPRVTEALRILAYSLAIAVVRALDANMAILA